MSVIVTVIVDEKIVKVDEWILRLQDRRMGILVLCYAMLCYVHMWQSVELQNLILQSLHLQYLMLVMLAMYYVLYTVHRCCLYAQ